MKNFILKEEFFGGIIYDKTSKENISIDKETYNLLKILDKENENYSKYIEKLEREEIDKEEILEILRELAENRIINSNIEYKSNKEIPNNFLTAPFRIFYDITYKCNLRCKHCFTNSGNKNPKELTLKEKLELVEQMAELGVERVSIAGGEPFCSEDLYDFIKKCNEYDIGVSISTNGTLFTKENINIINNLKIKNLTISFDGGSKESMDFIRGKGTYDKVIEGLDNLKKYYKGKYSIKTTLMKNNINEIENLINIAIKYKCNMIKFNCVREDGRAVLNKEDIILTQEEYIKTIEEIEYLKDKYICDIDIKAPLNIFCDDEYEFIEELGFGCFAGKESFCINPLGDVKPCSHFPKEFICGNIKNNTLESIWKNSDILTKFRQLEGNKECNNCDKYTYCRGGCRYRCFMNGDINGIDPYCYLYKNNKEENMVMSK